MRTSISRLFPFVLLAFTIGLVSCDSDPLDDSPPPEWARSGLKGHDVQSLKARSGVLYATTDDGVYRRALDGGGGWTAAGLQGKTVVDLTWRSDGAFLAGVRYEGEATGPVLYKGASTSTFEWSPYDEGYGPEDRRRVRALAAIPGSRDTVLARSSKNVARSIDGGAHWTSTWKDWDQIGYQDPLLYVSPHDPSVVFAGGESPSFQPYLVRSDDYGTSWTSPSGVSTGGDNAVYSIIEHPEEPGRFLLGMEGHVLRSDDGGHSWSVAYRPPEYTYVFDFAARTVEGQTVVYAAGAEDGTQGGLLTLHRTTDFGDHWDRIPYAEGPESTAIRAIALVGDGDQTRLYLGTMDGVYVYRP